MYEVVLTKGLFSFRLIRDGPLDCFKELGYKTLVRGKRVTALSARCINKQ